jgi:hypothetical protein
MKLFQNYNLKTNKLDDEEQTILISSDNAKFVAHELSSRHGVTFIGVSWAPVGGGVTAVKV